MRRQVRRRHRRKRPIPASVRSWTPSAAFVPEWSTRCATNAPHPAIRSGRPVSGSRSKPSGRRRTTAGPAWSSSTAAGANTRRRASLSASGSRGKELPKCLPPRHGSAAGSTRPRRCASVSDRSGRTCGTSVAASSCVPNIRRREANLPSRSSARPGPTTAIPESPPTD